MPSPWYEDFRTRFVRTGLRRAIKGRYLCQCRYECARVGGQEVLNATLDRHRMLDLETFGTCSPVPTRIPKRPKLAGGWAGREGEGNGPGERAQGEGVESTSESSEEEDYDELDQESEELNSQARPTKRARLSSSPTSTSSSTQQTRSSAPIPSSASTIDQTVPSHSNSVSDQPPPTAPSPSSATATALNAARQRQVDALIAQLAAEQAAEDEASAAVERQKAERGSQFSKLFKAARKDAKQLANADDIEAGWAEFCAAQREREKEAARLMGEEGDGEQPGPEVDESGGGPNGQEGGESRVVKEEPRGD